MLKLNTSKDLITSQLESLSASLFSGDKKEVEQWFIKNNFKKNKKLKSSLLNKALYSHGFFSYRCTSHNKDDLNKESIWRHQAIMRHYSFKDQVELINQFSLDCALMPEHLDSLTFFPSLAAHQKLLLNNDIINTLGLISCKLFNDEQFDMISALEQKLKTQILSFSISTAPIYHSSRNVKGCFYIHSEDSFFTPLECIIYNYSKEKLDFLLSKNLTPPSSCAATLLNEVVKQKMKTSFHANNQDYFNFVDEKLRQYIILNEKEELSKGIGSLPSSYNNNSNNNSNNYPNPTVKHKV